MIDPSCESNVKTVVEEHVSSKNIYCAGRWYEIAIYHQTLLVTTEVSKLYHFVINKKQCDQIQFFPEKRL